MSQTAIQPHGMLVGFGRDSYEVVALSENLPGELGVAAMGSPVRELFTDDSWDLLADWLTGEGGAPVGFVPGLSLRGSEDLVLDATIHRSGTAVILELEPVHDPVRARFGSFVSNLQASVQRVQGAASVAEAARAAAAEVRRLCGFDRVLVYEFLTDWSGHVIAEEGSGRLESYLDLRFPSTDIPARARELYRRSPVRIIPDACAGTVGVRSAVELDLGGTMLRAVDPCHLQYLANMGVRASMSVSVVRDGKLWGLVACHHADPLFVHNETRYACSLVAQVLGHEIELCQTRERERYDGELQTIREALLHDLMPGSQYREALSRHADDLLRLMRACGLAIVSQDRVKLIGQTPDEQQVNQLLEQLAAKQVVMPFASDCMVREFGLGDGAICGVLAVALSRTRPSYMIWFRPEWVRTVRWGGDPNQAVNPMTPRNSFAIWSETVKGRSAPWEEWELAAAGALRELLVDAIAGYAEQLERANRDLRRSNEELESFASVASHDLREPLRQIETLGSLLDGSGGELSDDTRMVIGGMRASARRMRQLIDGLRDLSLVHSVGSTIRLVDLDEVMAEVTFDLRTAIHEAGATVIVDHLPTIQGDAAQMRQLFQNLLSNAIRYRCSSRQLHVRVQTKPADPSNSLVRIDVVDNGIGFDPKYVEQVFEPFERLSKGIDAEGTGIGLTICRKIVHRHGGEISAHPAPGEGTRFSVLLPVSQQAGG